MKKKIIIISNWKNKDDFHKLKGNVENNLENIESFFYLMITDNSKKIEDLPQIQNSYYLSKRDFNLLGKLKTPMLRGLLMNQKEGVLIVALENESALLKQVIKHSNLMSIGIEKETLPNFDLSFTDSGLTGGKLFTQINNYLTKIRL
ncbi:hypothetical protein [Brumimicrobium mesophilum]|uniref:hypothetical protein n=1 Tax=Brumimicrobium mesophilum TaxID=392717 RepID=UPI00131C56CA|nr:hypothetical protein [Brumimicrobium mesophilum]